MGVGIPRRIGDFLDTLSQAILVGIILVGGLGAETGGDTTPEPMKSEPPTPTRAPANQSNNM